MLACLACCARGAATGLVALLLVCAASVSGLAQPASLAGEIAELERAVSQHEAAARAPRKGQAEPQREMQHLLALARLATLYAQADRMGDATAIAERLLARLEALFGPDHPSVATQLEALAATYATQNRYADAERLRKRAIVMHERASGPDSLQMAMSLQGMANLFRLQERYEDALPLATRALGIAQRRLEPGSSQRAIYVSQVADIYMSMRRYDEAEPLLKQALAIVEAAPDSGAMLARTQKMQYLQSLANAALAKGRHPEAQDFLERAIGEATALFGPGHSISAAMMLNLALQMSERGELDAAEQLYRRALPISERNGRLGAMLADNHAGLGIVAFRRQRWMDALAELRKSTAISVELERIARAGGTAPAESRAAPRADIYLLAAAAAFRAAEAQPAAAAALRDEAFQLAQRAERSSAGMALAQMAARIDAGDPAIAGMVRERQDLAAEWRRLDTQVEKALTAPGPGAAASAEGLRARLDAIARRLEAIDTRIQREAPGLARLSDPAPLSIGEVQALLGPGETLVLFAHRAAQTFVWAVSRETAHWHLSALGDEQAAQMVERLRCGLDETAWSADGRARCEAATGIAWRPGGPLPFDLATAHRLYQDLLGPIGHLARDAELIVATAGPLAALPLSVLVSEPSKGPPYDARSYREAAWVARRHPLALLPSVASLRALRAQASRSRADRPFLGIANPLLAGDGAHHAEASRAASERRSCAAAARLAQAGRKRVRAMHGTLKPLERTGGLVPAAAVRALTPLPETADEVCAVARDLGAGEGDVRLAEHAKEAEIKRMSASGALARYRVVHFATHGALAGQLAGASEPGLVLTPPAAASPDDDGYLSASEIAALKLDADWVILSACNTAAAARLGGDTLSGLARAFFYAQARAVLVSHWEVDSEAAVALTTRAIAEMAAKPGTGRSAALRRAMLDALSGADPARVHPSYWAPFVVVGEPAAPR